MYEYFEKLRNPLEKCGSIPTNKLKMNEGRVVIDKNKIKSTWKMYIAQLFQGDKVKDQNNLK
jgi:hypothetical protein